ncbi:MAG: LytR/AlgR family response regulator transcription factor [Owenweeksia sp.]
MSRFRIQIVEDNPLQLTKLEFFSKSHGYEVVATCDNAEEGGRLAAIKKPDLVLIDIQLNGAKSGVDLGYFISEKLDIPIIYLTSLVQTNVVEAASQTNPQAYLVKPIDEESLRVAIEMVRHKRETLRAELAEPEHELFGRDLLNDSIFIKVGKMLKRLLYADIVTIEASQVNHIAISVQSGQTWEIRQSLSSVEKVLPPHFCRVHRQRIINCKYVDAVRSDFSSISIGDEKIPVGTTYRKEIAAKINYLS